MNLREQDGRWRAILLMLSHIVSIGTLLAAQAVDDVSMVAVTIITIAAWIGIAISIEMVFFGPRGEILVLSSASVILTGLLTSNDLYGPWSILGVYYPPGVIVLWFVMMYKLPSSRPYPHCWKCFGSGYYRSKVGWFTRLKRCDCYKHTMC